MMDNSPIPKLFVRLNNTNITEALQSLEQGWRKVAGADSFTFSFIDERINAQYRSDHNLGRIITIATLLAILIGGMGLYGLSSLTLQNRVKEISIRKVLGATSRSILVLLSKDFLVMIAINLLISVPLTVYFMRQWLQNYEYKVTIDWTVFLVAGVISLLIGALTISYQTIKTARAQPAETLKAE
jgi:putative ABC transport system permease protein